MAAEEQEPGTGPPGIEAALVSTSRSTRFLAVIKDKIRNTLTLPGRRTTIPGIITNNKTTLKNLLISLIVLGLEFLLNSKVFHCPVENHQSYGRFWLYSPPVIIFFVNLLLIGDIWNLSDRCLVCDYYRRGYFCGHTIPNIVKAMVGASVWLTLAFFRKDYYVCGEVGPDIRKRNVTDPDKLKEYDLAVETAKAESQIFAWTVFLVAVFIGTMVVIIKKCCLKDQDLLDDIRVFEEREAKWAKKIFNEFAQGLRNDDLNDSSTEDPNPKANASVVNEATRREESENLEETSRDPEITKGKVDDNKEDNDSVADDDNKEGNNADEKKEENEVEEADQEINKDEEVKITLYPDGIPEKFGEIMVMEMFKDWKERKPNWHYYDAYKEFKKLYPRAATGDPSTRWSTTRLSKQFPIRATPENKTNAKLPATQSNYGCTGLEMMEVAPKSKVEIPEETTDDTTALI